MNLIHHIQRRLRINRAIRDLSALSDSILLDIGVQRSEIVHLVEKSIGSTAGRSLTVTPLVHENETSRYHVPSGAAA